MKPHKANKRMQKQKQQQQQQHGLFSKVLTMGCTQSSTVTNETLNTSPSSIKVVTAEPATPASSSISNKLALGAGCYWGTEKYVVRDFQKKFTNSIKAASVGFMSPLTIPRIKHPNYKQVCSGQSGHVEVLYVELNDPSRHFEELCRFFFTFHDPTLKNRQGNDIGFQYSSWIFCDGDEQYDIATRVKKELQIAINQRYVKSYTNRQVETQITNLSKFTKAHQAHQQYLFKNPNGYCNHRIRLKQWHTYNVIEPHTMKAVDGGEGQKQNVSLNKS